MTQSNSASKILAQILSLIPKAKSTESQLLADFIKVFYAHTSISDLQSHSVEDLYGLAVSQWQLMAKRSDQPLVEVFNPDAKENGWGCNHTIIQIATDDMPFLVDSVLMILNQMRLTIYLSIHAGDLVVQHGGKNTIKGFKQQHAVSKSDDYQVQAAITIEIDRITDADKLTEISTRLQKTLADVAMAVHDWQAMQDKLAETMASLIEQQPYITDADVNEARGYLKWLGDNHFTFLGYREYEVTGKGADRALKLVSNSGLGVLRDESNSKVIRKYSDLPEAARQAALSTDNVLIISKTNTRSTVHRPTYTDYIGIKQFNQKGEIVGERRFIGLYTSTAYSEDPVRIPFVRNKVAAVLSKSNLNPTAHAGKDLTHILSTFPRDDLFHASVDQLYDISMGILQIQERRQVKVFIREDQYGRYISCIVYMPREDFNTDRVLKIQSILRDVFHAKEVTTNTHFSESVLARVHYTIRLEANQKVSYDLPKLEERIVEVARSWREMFRESLYQSYPEQEANDLYQRYRLAFPAGYREWYSAHEAIYDVRKIEKLSDQYKIKMSFYHNKQEAKSELQFKMYQKEVPVSLTDAVPLLENMGLRVLREQPYKLVAADGQIVWLNHFNLVYAKETNFSVEEVADIFRKAFYRTWSGRAENDGFNRLVLDAQLDWRQISMLRAYAKYFKQIGVTFTQAYIEQTLLKNNKLARLLVDLFDVKFNPARTSRNVDAVERKLEDELKQVQILDEDKIIRKYWDVINATVRTNFYQRTAEGEYKDSFVFKLKPQLMTGIPLPVPYYEAFVYSPRFEGVHLRMAKVARGGLRWSDRPEDFRTEILGLMKAQQVKNAVIVPAGAKGGFVPKHLPLDQGREAILTEAVACYQSFINGLLDVTDNIVEDKTVQPADTVCYDADDSYLVVAADKGTATFSDFANSIALERGFWLGDAFASGGSTGYDHKKMGITAKGAWVSGERHFQEMGIDLNTAEIKVVGIGDMSGDVFGNGMLLSKDMKLVAAFNHLHIFIDPNPNPAVSFEERKRLFNLPRSTWADYDAKLISRGGGVFKRTDKAISLSATARKLLGIEHKTIEPEALIRAILCAPVDMVWNGGVGTYVRASTERNADVGDRANDRVRVSANQLQAKVVCEGGNLGLTQAARVEFALLGGRINSDFVDNSAGVDCSDHEVNAKILLSEAMRHSDLNLPARNKLLAQMTDEVASLVLNDNYMKNQAISISEYNCTHQVNLFSRYIKRLESEYSLNRELESLPSHEELLQRGAEGKSLVRPELAVILAYSKIMLKHELLKTPDLNTDYLRAFLYDGFPKPLATKYADLCVKHPLANEIIATQVANHIITEMGITFIHRIQEETNAPVLEIVKAYIVVTRVLHYSEILEAIDQLDGKVDSGVQYDMLSEASRVIRRCILWFLRNYQDRIDVTKAIEQFAEPVEQLFARISKLVLGHDKRNVEEKIEKFIAQGVPYEVAEKVANARALYHCFNIIDAMRKVDHDLYKVAKVYFLIVDRLDLLRFRDYVNAYLVNTRWSVLAKAGLKADIDWIQRRLTVLAIQADVEAKRSAIGIVNSWFDSHQEVIDRCRVVINEFFSAENKDFEFITVVVRELRQVVRLCT